MQRRAWSATRQSLDPAFASGGTATIDFDQDGNLSESAATGAAFDAQGRVVIVGYSSIDGSGTQNMAIARGCKASASSALDSTARSRMVQRRHGA